MARVLVVATSPWTHGGITEVLKLYKKSQIWQKYQCRWIGTHRDGNKFRKLCYFFYAYFQFICVLPFYDIVHIHLGLTPSAWRKFLFFKLAKLFRKKVVIHLHCGSQIDEIWCYVYQKMFEQCDCGVVLSENLKHKIIEHIGDSDKIRVIYNPCPPIPNNIRYAKEDIILFTGRIYEGKGYKDLLKSFSFISNRYPNWKLVFAGIGEVEVAKVMAQELGISSQVEMLGWVSGEDKHRIFSQARVFCLPSYAEGFPMAVLDAWAYSLPVITTPVGGIPDIAKDGENLLLFNPGDVNKLSACLESLISSDLLREKLSKESLNLAQTTFNIETVNNQISALYDSLCNS